MTGISHIAIDLEKTCQIGPFTPSFGARSVYVAGNSMAQKNSIYGWGYAIRTEDAIRSARSHKMNLDDYLTAQMAIFLNELSGRKSPVLIWYANVQDLILPFITSRRECGYMSVDNSFDGHSSAYLSPNAEPFMYYDGNRVYRVYFRHSGIANDENLLFDLGTLFPLRTGNSEGWRYNEIIESPLDDRNIYYSAIVQERDFIAEWQGKKVAVERAFCSLRYRGIVSSCEKQEDEMDDYE